MFFVVTVPKIVQPNGGMIFNFNYYPDLAQLWPVCWFVIFDLDIYEINFYYSCIGHQPLDW